jgi:hypothetical protein
MDPARAHGVLLDVTDFAAIDAAIAPIQRKQTGSDGFPRSTPCLRQSERRYPINLG